MAARGALSKETITNKILGTFSGSFINGKEIRIPCEENGEVVEIKVTLVAAKDTIGAGSASTEPTPVVSQPASAFQLSGNIGSASVKTEPTQEEKDMLTRFLASL